jgi:hypothetical protein
MKQLAVPGGDSCVMVPAGNESRFFERGVNG